VKGGFNLGESEKISPQSLTQRALVQKNAHGGRTKFARVQVGESKGKLAGFRVATDHRGLAKKGNVRKRGIPQQE